MVICIRGAIRNTPLAVLEEMLDLQPLVLFIKRLAAEEALRLEETKLWTQNGYEHSEILHEVTEFMSNLELEIFRQSTDYTVTRNKFSNDIKIGLE